MKYVLTMLISIVITLFVLDYVECRKDLHTALSDIKVNKIDIKDNYDELYEGEPGDSDKGLWWRFFLLRDRVTELETDEDSR